MEMNLNSIWFIVLCAVCAKSMIVGSDFNFYYWIRCGKKYTDWYNNRPKFKP
jgi:hypothetical protein